MCSPARCAVCGKVTWTGCGSHVDDVMAHVPAAQQCRCAPIPTERGDRFRAYRRPDR